MACVVDMSWGDAQRGLLIERDESGEVTDVRILRMRSAPDPRRRSFYCSGQVWYDTLDLARKHGWRPAGTMPAEDAHDAWASKGGCDGTFEPRLRPYVKEVRAEDAAALADALTRALGDPVEMAMLRIALDAARDVRHPEHMPAAAQRPLSSAFLRDFIVFLRKGPFVFAWRDL
jgi:hypothetical protein